MSQVNKIECNDRSSSSGSSSSSSHDNSCNTTTISGCRGSKTLSNLNPAPDLEV